MSEEFCDGVKILLKRMESNPEEFKNSDKWQKFVSITNAANAFWECALTPAEIEALRNGLRKIYREVFTDRVMSTLLEDKQEHSPFTATVGWADIGGVGGGAQGLYNPAQTSITATNGTSYASITQDAKKLGLGELLKQKLAKL